MIIILMNKKRGLNILSKLPDDGDPWAPNNLLKPEQKKQQKKKTTKNKQLNTGGQSNRQEAPAPTN